MTLIVGLRCSDGVVLASDSAAEDSQAGTRSQADDKIWQIGAHPVICGASGNVGAIQDVREALGSFKIKQTKDAVRRNLVGIVRPIQERVLKQHVEFPKTVPPTATILAAGVAEDGPFLLEISYACETTWYHDEQGNFYAIGIGAGLAHALFRRFLKIEEYNLELGCLLAYRVVSDAINLSARGLMEPVHVLHVSSDGRATRLDKDEIRRFGDRCSYWLEREWEILDDLTGRRSAGSSTPDPVPEPPASPG